MPILESTIEKKYVSWIKAEKLLCWKLNPLGYMGLPDRIILGPRRTIFFIEFKRPGERPRRIQEWVHEQIRGYGFNVYVCESFEEAKAATAAEVGRG